MSELNSLDKKFLDMLEQIKKMFLEYGIKNLNMDEISRKLCISKKTLYRYVSSKEDLIERLFQYEELKWNDLTRELNEKHINAIEKLFEVSFRVHQEMKHFNPRSVFELRKYYEPIWNKYLGRKREFIRQKMTLNLQQGIEEGLYRPDLNPELVITIYVSNLVEMDNYAVANFGKVSLDQLFEVIFENHIRAISTPEGVAYFEKRRKEIESNKANDLL